MAVIGRLWQPTEDNVWLFKDCSGEVLETAAQKSPSIGMAIWKFSSAYPTAMLRACSRTSTRLEDLLAVVIRAKRMTDSQIVIHRLTL